MLMVVFLMLVKYQRGDDEFLFSYTLRLPLELGKEDIALAARKFGISEIIINDNNELPLTAEGHCAIHYRCIISLNRLTGRLSFSRFINTDEAPIGVEVNRKEITAKEAEERAVLFLKGRELYPVGDNFEIIKEVDANDQGEWVVSLRLLYPLKEGVSTLVAGAGATLVLLGEEVHRAYIYWPDIQSPANNDLLEPTSLAVQRSVQSLGMNLSDNDSWALVFNTRPEGKPSTEILPNVIAVANFEAEQEINNQQGLAYAHHNETLLFLPMCFGDKQCKTGKCNDDGLCDNEKQEEEDGDDPGDTPPPVIFGEEIDRSICTSPEPPQIGTFMAAGWSVEARNSRDRGLVLSDVTFAANNFASEIVSVQDYTLQTGRGTFTGCRLEPAGNSSKDCHSWLLEPGIKFLMRPPWTTLRIDSAYCVEGFPAATDNTLPEECRAKLLVVQSYRFGAIQTSPTPGDFAAMAPWDPAVGYVYFPPEPGCPSNNFSKLTINTYIDNDVGGLDIAGFFKDNNTFMAQIPVVPSVTIPGSGGSMAVFGTPGTYDNYHQKDALNITSISTAIHSVISVVWTTITNKTFPLRPSNEITIPGCSGILTGDFKCAHYHWRWGTNIANKWKNYPVTPGNVLTPTTQRIDADAFHASSTTATLPFNITTGSNIMLHLKGQSTAPMDTFHLAEHFFFR